VWNWRTGATLAILRGQAGELKDTTSTEGSTRIWDWRAAKAVTQVSWHVALVHSCAFSPDGTRLLTASDDWSADVFRCETCGPLADLITTARARITRTITPAELKQLLGSPKAP
jgi:hypothetical protein